MRVGRRPQAKTVANAWRSLSGLEVEAGPRQALVDGSRHLGELDQSPDQGAAVAPEARLLPRQIRHLPRRLDESSEEPRLAARMSERQKKPVSGYSSAARWASGSSPRRR
jgi:hypothetical protein